MKKIFFWLFCRILACSDYEDMFLPLGLIQPAPHIFGEKQSSFLWLGFSWECSAGNHPNHRSDLNLVKIHLGFALASLVMFCTTYPGTRMHIALGPPRGPEPNEVSVVCLQCVFPVSSWSVRTWDGWWPETEPTRHPAPRTQYGDAEGGGRVKEEAGALARPGLAKVHKQWLWVTTLRFKE